MSSGESRSFPRSSAVRRPLANSHAPNGRSSSRKIRLFLSVQHHSSRIEAGSRNNRSASLCGGAGGDMIHKVEATIGGRTLTIETGRVAEQAGGAVLLRYGDTVVLGTATASESPREGIDFFPLTVDVEERMYAAGKIPGGFIKREGRPTEHSILASRLTDRPIRPLFPKGYRSDVQVVITVLSVDQENDPDILGVIGASAALSLSD